MADKLVYLVWDSASFTTGMAQNEVRAPYASLKEAREQADLDHDLGRQPKRIEDGDGKVLWTAPE